MNQALLTRLFKSIDGESNKALLQVAKSIINDEKRLGHNKLAEKLTIILNNRLNQKKKPSLKKIHQKEFKIPVDRRYRLPLATHVQHENLRHEMILDDLIESKLVRIEKEYLSRERLFHHGLKPKKKILLYGASGCGKSMAAERIAWDLGLPFYKVRFDSIISSYLGESASNLFQLLESIQNYGCVLLLDEFDIIGKKRELSSKDIGEIHRIVNILLGLLEDYDGEGILIATTNLEGSLDNALFRRFDDIIKFEKPSKKEIERLLQQTLSALKVNQELNLKTLSSKMEGFSYALIEKIANDAAKHSIIATKNNITLNDFKIAIRENSALVS